VGSRLGPKLTERLPAGIGEYHVGYSWRADRVRSEKLTENTRIYQRNSAWDFS
jgi:hypothetical protein